MPNRQASTLQNVILNNINSGSHIKSDGHPSYPTAIQNCNIEHDTEFTHEIVNHTHGFINLQGTHTNTIEGFWAHLREFWRERHVISRNRLEKFLSEFKFLKFFIDKKGGQQ